MKYWNLNLFNKDPKHRCFFILKSPDQDYLDMDTFKPIMKSIFSINKYPSTISSSGNTPWP